MNPTLKSLNDVEIFSAGKWNGDDYTEADLDEMVRAFAETSSEFQPYIKISHDNEQSLIKNSELPSAGYVSNLKRVGKKLIADFIDIPEKIYFLMKNKAYKSRSSEVFWDIDFNGKKFNRMLKAVALLGADMPAVSSLDDIISFYGLNPEKSREKTKSSVILKICSFDKNAKKDGINMELEKKNKDLENKLDQATKNYSKIEKDLKAKEDALAAKEKAYAELETKQKQIEIENKEKEIKNFAQSLVSEKLATPAMAPLVEALLGAEKTEYAISHTVKKEGKDDETLEKKYNNKNEIVKEILKLYSEASKVNFDENSEDTEIDKGENALEAKIAKYALDHKVDEGIAYREVMREQANNKE